jgi:hypothetical protein
VLCCGGSGRYALFARAAGGYAQAVKDDRRVLCCMLEAMEGACYVLQARR